MSGSNKSQLKPYILHAGESLPEHDAGVKASISSTGGKLTLIESHTNGGAPLHLHTKEDEYFYVVEGKIVVKCDGNIFHAEKGSFIFLPRDIAHEWDVESENGATVLMITVPAMLENFLHKFHAADSKEKRAAIADEFGLKFF
ncbi:MAG: cupin domain-containing protein [Bacteroidetes bacterium]|nr:cupin domain-containing protein [Bacteroidota bacterium]